MKTECPAQRGAPGGACSSLSEKSRAGSHHQKQPRDRQHLLNRRPEPHGHRSFRPSFSSSNLSPWTIRTPRLTCVSDGKPRRRLLMISKGILIIMLMESHRTPPRQTEIRDHTGMREEDSSNAIRFAPECGMTRSAAPGVTQTRSQDGRILANSATARFCYGPLPRLLSSVSIRRSPSSTVTSGRYPKSRCAAAME